MKKFICYWGATMKCCSRNVCVWALTFGIVVWFLFLWRQNSQIGILSKAWNSHFWINFFSKENFFFQRQQFKYLSFFIQCHCNFQKLSLTRRVENKQFKKKILYLQDPEARHPGFLDQFGFPAPLDWFLNLLPSHRSRRTSLASPFCFSSALSYFRLAQVLLYARPLNCLSYIEWHEKVCVASIAFLMIFLYKSLVVRINSFS